jgi:predicted nucleic acid-binding protein
MRIVVDTSVWVNYFNGIRSPQVLKLDKAIDDNAPIFVGDLIICEVLQGFRFPKSLSAAKSLFQTLERGPMTSVYLAEQAADNYRALRSKGITTRNSIDVMIATYCLENNARLLHEDRDFIPFEKHLGLLGTG